MGGRGGWWWRNIAVASSTLKKPNIAFYTNKAIWVREEG